MNTKVSIGIIIAALLVAGGYIWYARTHLAAPTSPLVDEFTWSFLDRGVEASSSIPKTDVALRIAGVDVPLGTYDGSCFAVAGSQWPLLQGEVSGAICYWAGGGREIGVFEEGGKLVLKQGDVDEGDAETPGTRGNFVPLTKQPNLK